MTQPNNPTAALQPVAVAQILVYMPRAFDASFDAGDNYRKFHEDQEGLSDAEVAAALAFEYLAEHEEQIDDLDSLAVPDEEVATEAPPDQEADQPEDASGEDGSQDSSAPADSVIDKSLRETVEAAEQWTFEKTLEFMADAFHPGAGRLISMGFKIKEIVSDVQAVAGPDSPRNLHVPLFHVAGGLAVDLNVHLRGADGSGDGTPPVSGFLSPGDGGLFGGWEIETDRPAEADQGELSPEQDAIFELAEQAARQAVERADRARLHTVPESLVIEYDLSPVARRVLDPRRRAVVLREVAARVRAGLYARPQFTAQPIVVIYDPLAGLGMWLVKPALADALAGRRISIGLNPVTGVTIVSTE